MRVLIIGAGFIGRYLAGDLVARGHQVALADREARLAGVDEASGIGRRELDPLRIDAADPAFSGLDAVINLHSRSSPLSSMDDIEADAAANVLPAIRILEACRRREIPTFIFASSGGTVYGETAGDRIDENSPTNPINAYGAAKLAVEKYMRVYARRDGIRAVALRIANAYGPGQLRFGRVGAVANFVERIRRNQPIEVWGDGASVRDYVYVSDIAAAFALGLERSEFPSGEYNVGSEEGRSVRDVISEIENVSGRRAEIRFRPARTVDVARLVLDCRKLRDVAGWRASVPFRAGVQSVWTAASQAEVDR